MWLFGLLGIVVSVVPQSQQRYRTVGDWTITKHDTHGWLLGLSPTASTIRVTVSETGSWRYNFLLALHESVEAWLCRRHGVTQAMVDTWDTVEWLTIKVMVQHFKYHDEDGQCRQALDNDEPGDWPDAPYHLEHMDASRVERWAARLLLVNWRAYEARLDALLDQRHP